MPLAECPVCGSRQFTLLRSRRRMAADLAVCERHVRTQFDWEPTSVEMTDLCHFTRAAASALVRCSVCGTLQRAEPTGGGGPYEDDTNDPEWMDQVYPRFLEVFRDRTTVLQRYLDVPHAHVLEVGSHLGAFLQASEERDWRALGLDIGNDTEAYIRRRGLRVRKLSMEEFAASAPAEKFDAVTIWNCFEQLPNPAVALESAYRLLKPHGVLTLRVPNARFFTEQLPRAEHSLRVRRALIFNNLLGFPYLYGYSASSLLRLAAAHGFHAAALYNSELVTSPFVEPSARATRTQTAVSRWAERMAALHPGEAAGPWFELVLRRSPEGTSSRSFTLPARQDVFLARSV